MSGESSPPPPFKYRAFISYSSKDLSWARWLHRRLERYPIPGEFHATRFEDGTVLGPSLRPIFRDRDELAGVPELGPAITRGLEQSRYLIVLCSPNAAKSEWVEKEIIAFRKMGGNDRILSVIVAGEPNATDNPDLADDLECFPPAFRLPAQPLAGDLRPTGDGKERGFLKLVAGLARLDFDSLYRRHERARRQRLVWTSVAALAVMLSLATLAAVAWVQRNRAEVNRLEAVRQKGEAEASDRRATEQRDLARNRLADSYFTKGSNLIEAGESLAGIRELAAALAVDPAHRSARQRLFDHLAGHNYPLPLSGKLAVSAGDEREDASLLGVDPEGRILLRNPEAILSVGLAGGVLSVKGTLGFPDAKKIETASYHPQSRRLAVWWNPKPPRRIGRVSVFEWDAAGWQPVMEEEVDAGDRFVFSKDGSHLYVQAMYWQQVWDLKGREIAFSRQFRFNKGGSPGSECAGGGFSRNGKLAVLCIDDRYELLDLESRRLHAIPFLIETEKFRMPSFDLRTEDPLLLVSSAMGLRRVKVGADGDGRINGHFEDWGVMEEPASPLPRRLASTSWAALGDRYLVYSLKSGGRVMLDTGLIGRESTVEQVIAKKEDDHWFKALSPANCRQSQDGRFLLHVDEKVDFYDLHLLDRPCETLQLEPRASDACWWGGEGTFAVLNVFGELQAFTARGTGFPGVGGMALGMIQQPEIAAFSHGLVLEPRSAKPWPLHVFETGVDPPRKRPVEFGSLSAGDAMFVNQGRNLLVAFVDRTSFDGDDALVAFDSADLAKPPHLIGKRRIEGLIDLEGPKVIAMRVDMDDAVEVRDRESFEVLFTIPGCGSVFSVEKWIAISDDRGCVVWRMDEYSVGFARIRDRTAVDVKKIKFDEPVEALGLSETGQYAGAILKSGRSAIWSPGMEGNPRLFETKARPDPGILIDELNQCYHLVSGTSVGSYDLKNGSIVSMTPLGYSPSKLAFSPIAGEIRASQDFLGTPGMRGTAWSWPCPDTVSSTELQTLATAITGWTCSPETLESERSERFGKPMEEWIGSGSQDQREGRLRMVRLPDPAEGEWSSHSVMALAERGRLDMLGVPPTCHRFHPLMRACEAISQLSYTSHPRTSLAESALPFLTAATDVKSGTEALIYCELLLKVGRKDDALQYFGRSKELGWPPAVAALGELLQRQLQLER